jgi:hypothetical protein
VVPEPTFRLEFKCQSSDASFLEYDSFDCSRETMSFHRSFLGLKDWLPVKFEYMKYCELHP